MFDSQHTTIVWSWGQGLWGGYGTAKEEGGGGEKREKTLEQVKGGWWRRKRRNEKPIFQPQNSIFIFFNSSLCERESNLRIKIMSYPTS